MHIPQSERVGELYEIIRKAQEELDEIKKNCNHPGYYVGYYSWRVGSMIVSRICDTCNECLPGVTEEETQKFELGEQERLKEWMIQNGGNP